MKRFMAWSASRRIRIDTARLDALDNGDSHDWERYAAELDRLLGLSVNPEASG